MSICHSTSLYHSSETNMLDSPSPSPSNIVDLTDLLNCAIPWILKRDKQYDVRLTYARGNRELAEEFLRHAQAELGMTATTHPAKKSQSRTKTRRSSQQSWRSQRS